MVKKLSNAQVKLAWFMADHIRCLHYCEGLQDNMPNSDIRKQRKEILTKLNDRI